MNKTFSVKNYFEVGEIRKPVRFLGRYMRLYLSTYVWLLIVMALGVFVTIGFAWFLKNLTDAAVSLDMHRMVRLLFLGLPLILVDGIVIYGNIFFESAAVNKIIRDVKNDLFHHILRLPASYFNHNHSGEMVSRLTKDAENIRGIVGMNVINMIQLPVTAIAAMIFLVSIDAKLAVITLVFGPLAVCSGAVFGKMLRNNGRLLQDAWGKQYRLLNDSLFSQTVIRSFSLERLFLKRYTDHNDTLAALELKRAKLSGWFQLGASGALSIAYLANIGIGTWFVAQGTLSVGSLLAFATLMQHLIYPFTGMAGQWGGFQSSLASVERLMSVFETPVETKALPRAMPCREAATSIEFRGIRFSYDGAAEVFSGFHLTVPANQVTALVGSSGSGKSTLFLLLQGFYKPDHGEILFGREPIDRMSLSQLRSLIAYVPQEAVLFDGTIKENISYGNLNADMEEIIQAARDANIHDFILSLPGGYETNVGERGAKLSGGQKQRIAIARALLKNAPVLLLDEATSALDSDTEHLVKNALDRLMKNRTTLVIAHRISTIQNADQIVVMDKGGIIELGRHRELLAKGGLYSHLYQLQFPEESLLFSR